MRYLTNFTLLFFVSTSLANAEVVGCVPLAQVGKETRSATTDGGFAFGMTAKEIQDVADSFSNEARAIYPILGKKIETSLLNANHRKGFWAKTAVLIRDIAGSHLFNDANHRIAFTIVKKLMSRNGIVTKVSDEKLYFIISKVGRNAHGYKTVEEITAALRGY